MLSHGGLQRLYSADTDVVNWLVKGDESAREMNELFSPLFFCFGLFRVTYL